MLKVNSDDPQFYSKMIIRMGNSGSPILNSNNEVVGINSGGMNNTNANATVRAKMNCHMYLVLQIMLEKKY